MGTLRGRFMVGAAGPAGSNSGDATSGIRDRDRQAAVNNSEHERTKARQSVRTTTTRNGGCKHLQQGTEVRIVQVDRFAGGGRHTGHSSKLRVWGGKERYRSINTEQIGVSVPFRELVVVT